MSNKPLTDREGEVRELDAEDLSRFKLSSEVIPEILEMARRARGRPKAEITKQSITIRLSAEVTDYFRSTGKGWQTRVDEALLEYVRKQQ